MSVMLTTQIQEPPMEQVIVTREIKSDVNAVWAVLDDFASIYKYNPSVKHSELLSNKTTGMDAQRICHFYDGTSLKETITHYQPNKGYGFELSDFKLPLKFAETQISLNSVGVAKSSVTVTLSFVPKFGPLGWLMAKLLMKPMLKKALTGLLQGLDDHTRSGQLVLQDGSLVAA